MNTTGPHDDLLFVGTHGHVAAIEKRTGKTIWTASLPKTGWGVVSIVYEDDTLFCAGGGRVLALDPKNGYILWENPLKGLGSGLVYQTTAQSNDTQAAMAALAAAAAASQQAAGASGTS